MRVLPKSSPPFFFFFFNPGNIDAIRGTQIHCPGNYLLFHIIIVYIKTPIKPAHKEIDTTHAATSIQVSKPGSRASLWIFILPHRKSDVPIPPSHTQTMVNVHHTLPLYTQEPKLLLTLPNFQMIGLLVNPSLNTRTVWTTLSFDVIIFVLTSYTLGNIFEYKYIWRDRNTNFSKMRGRYDRARCLDNFNHKKVIIRGWAPVSDCIPAFAYCRLWLQTW